MLARKITSKQTNTHTYPTQWVYLQVPSPIGMTRPTVHNKMSSQNDFCPAVLFMRVNMEYKLDLTRFPIKQKYKYIYISCKRMIMFFQCKFDFVPQRKI